MYHQFQSFEKIISIVRKDNINRVSTSKDNSLLWIYLSIRENKAVNQLNQEGSAGVFDQL